MKLKTIYHSESQLEKIFCDKIKKLGGLPLKFVSPGRAGVPDRIILLPGGKFYFVEMKNEIGKTSIIQEYIFEKFAKLGFKVHIINSVESMKNFLSGIENEI